MKINFKLLNFSMVYKNIILALFLINFVFSCKQKEVSITQPSKHQLQLSNFVNDIVENTINEYKISKNCFLKLNIKKVKNKETLFTIRPYYSFSEGNNQHYLFIMAKGYKIFLENDFDVFVNYSKKTLPPSYNFDCTDFIAKQFILKEGLLFEIEKVFDTKIDDMTNYVNSGKYIYENRFNVCEYESYLNFKKRIKNKLKLLKNLGSTNKCNFQDMQ